MKYKMMAFSNVLNRRLMVRTFSFFTNREPVPVDPVFSVTEAFIRDGSKNKVNLGVGAYQDKNGKPWVLPVVRKVEKEIAHDDSLDKEYLPVSGDPQFADACVDLIFGKENVTVKEGKVYQVAGIQSLSGAGAFRIGIEHLRKYHNFNTIYVSKPTWAIHKTLSHHAGIQNIREYTYYNPKEKNLNFSGMLDDLKNAEDGSIIVFHGAGHNPTGVDPSKEQWNEISALFKTKKLFPYFDSAYMGFCSGNVENDAYPIRKFCSDGHEMYVGLSFAKIMGLYNERVGCLAVVSQSQNDAKILKDQIKIIIRNNYSNPPSHGCRIVKRVLCDPQNYKDWNDQLNVMSDRIKEMRQKLYTLIEELGTPGDWSHIVNQTGLFTFTGLTENQVLNITKKHHIYLTKNGRINICGLTPSNIEYVANAIDDVVRND